MVILLLPTAMRQCDPALLAPSPHAAQVVAAASLLAVLGSSLADAGLLGYLAGAGGARAPGPPAKAAQAGQATWKAVAFAESAATPPRTGLPQAPSYRTAAKRPARIHLRT